MKLEQIFDWDKFKNFYQPTLNLIGVQITIYMPFLFSTIYVGRLGDAIAMSAFGLTSTFLAMFFNAVILGA